MNNTEIETEVREFLEDIFDGFNDYDVTVEEEGEKRDLYFCEVWAYSEDTIINDLCETARGYDAQELASEIARRLGKRIKACRKLENA